MKIGDLVRFSHEHDGGPVHCVVSVMRDGMVELNDMGGYFAPHLFVAADDIGGIPQHERPKNKTQGFAVCANLREEIMRLMRENFDPTPPNWEGRDWYDNAEDVADKIIALFGSEKPTQVSDSQTPSQIAIDAYLGILVLRTMCKKASLRGGLEASDQLLARMEAEFPALPALTSLRALSKETAV